MFRFSLEYRSIRLPIIKHIVKWSIHILLRNFTIRMIIFILTHDFYFLFLLILFKKIPARSRSYNENRMHKFKQILDRDWSSTSL